MTEILSNVDRVYFAALESTYNTDAVAAAIAADDNLVQLPCTLDTAIRPIARYDVPAVATPGEAGVSGKLVKVGGQVDVGVPLRGGIGTDFDPEVAMFLQAAGFIKSNPNATSTKFSLSNRVDQSMSLHEYTRNVLSADEWRLKVATGILFDYQLTLDAIGNEAIHRFSGNAANYPEFGVLRSYFNSSGAPLLDADGGAYTYLGTVSRAAGARLQCRNATFTYNGVTVPFESFTLAMNQAVAPIENGANSAIATARVGRERGADSNATIGVKFNFSDSTPGAFYADALAAYQADEIAAGVIKFDNGSQQVTINIAQVQLRRPDESPSASSAGFDIVGIVCADFSTDILGNGSVEILFDAAP